ncbi:hypothetical protein BST81_03545 [Leptolyngbya sp. 'hensonii']|uniref:hypothetical protein n=1 Tax=Leptolyngbya sp. 'hensonii' TaxID=1922337 RepID=UPI00094FC473|nr:hypothetical protein [Leptolyngbya sp. 'hensonii']OLP19817.1 hypothetical protein BST81_03545 [Leptolyngbya sp. 'hensonii']
MPLSLSSGQLLSRIIRRNVNAGVTGGNVINAQVLPGPSKIRTIDFVNSIQKVKRKNKFLDFIWNGAKTFFGNWLTGLNFLKISVSTIFGWGYSALESIKAFDWNASDKSLALSQQQLNIQLATIWGGLLGQGLGWLAGIGVGYGISLVVPVIGGAKLAKMIASAVALEGLDEIGTSFKAAISQTVRLFAGQAAISVYINYRQFLKGLPREWLVKFYGEDDADFILQVWGEEGGPNYSFNSYMDEQVNSIQNPVTQAFVEELLEEAWDSFIESGFIIAQELDTAYEQNKLALEKGTLGTNRTVVIEPDRANDSEAIVFQQVPQNLLIPAVQQTMATYHMLENRDIGQFVGESVDENARRSDPTLRLKIILYQTPAPPFERVRGNQRITRVTVSIPDVRRTKLDFEDIKHACGGVNGYLWGRFKANGKLSNGHYITVYAASRSDAEDRIKLFASLSEAELRTINITEELKEGDRLINPGLYKETTRIYPAYCFIINRELVLAGDRGRPAGKTRYTDRRFRLELWPSAKPHDWEEITQEALKKSY